MQLRYDFGEKLDLSKFRKQSLYYIKNVGSVQYQLFLPDYKVTVEIVKATSEISHKQVALSIYEISRDIAGEIVSVRTLSPMNDTRFKEIKTIQELWEPMPLGPGLPPSMVAEFVSDDPAIIVNRICDLIKIVHKINSLKVFL